MQRWERAVAYVADRSVGEPMDPSLSVTVNFHPDHLVDGIAVLDALSASGRYVSQYESRVSNGGLTAFPGGDRWQWESRIFGEIYDDAPAFERPKYGALNHRKSSVGAAPRFGSAHLRLVPEVLERSTFCYPDSTFQPEHFGVSARMSLQEVADGDDQDALDNYIEAQIHDIILMDRDVEALVLDPSFRGTDTEVAADELPCPIEWHDGFRLGVDDLQQHPEYRGEHVVELGASLAVDGYLDPRIVGDAFQSGEFDPATLKRVWHYIAKFGNPAI